MVRPVKREPRINEREVIEKVVNLEGNPHLSKQGAVERMSKQGAVERRALRSQYLAVKNLISNERDDISRQDSKKFKSIITQVEALHENVKKPREQVADAETLLGIANTLAASVRSQNSEGATPSELVTAMLKNFGHQQDRAHDDNSQTMVYWANIGLNVSHIFESVRGCCTMIGPMSNEIKQQKPPVYRKRTKPTESTLPEEISSKEEVTKTDTDSNMSAMFDILKKKAKVRLESLLLNKLSFAQTVENIFALSFLVKDGRAEIAVDENGRHLVSPKNAPSASAVASGAVSYHHFVFRFDFKDWKSMMEAVGPEEVLMPHRRPLVERSQPDSFCGNTQHAAAALSSTEANAAHSTPIRKLTRNRGLVVQEDSIVEDSIEKDPPCKKTRPNKGKCHLIF